MRALVLTSRSSRHGYFAQRIAGTFEVVAVLTTAKRDYYAEQREQSPAIQTHFQRIAEAEAAWFGSGRSETAPEGKLVADINAAEHVAWAVAQRVDVVCLFGTAILGQVWLEAFPSRIVNLHLGLSPFYRGSATLFWPFVDQELQYLGATIHLATAKVDGGNILARIDADLRPDEDYYTMTTRLIHDAIDRFPQVVMDYLEGRLTPQRQESVSGRLCRKSDFSDAALARALSYAGNGLSHAEIARIAEARACRYSR